MIIPVGLALGALSTVSSMVQQAASSISEASGNTLSALTQSSTSDQSQSDQTSQSTSGKFDQGTLAAMIALQGLGQDAATGTRFGKLDTDGDGSISKTEFETALGGSGVDTASADSLFSTLDANGDGSVGKNELAAPRSYQSHQNNGVLGGQSDFSSLMDSSGSDNATSQTFTNSDGSTTTTITYADGSTVSTTSAAPQSTDASTSTSSSSSSSTQGSPLEQLIKLQASLIGSVSSTTSTVA